MSNDISREVTRAIRTRGRFLKAINPPLRKLRRRRRPVQYRCSVMNAIPGCRGIISVLAQRLRTTAGTLRKVLDRDGWELIREAFLEESVTAKEGLVKNVFDIADFGLDIGARLKANTWLLEKLHPDFRPQTKVLIEGGVNPIQHEHRLLQIPAEVLQLSIADRMKVLDLADAQEAEFE